MSSGEVSREEQGVGDDEGGRRGSGIRFPFFPREFGADQVSYLWKVLESSFPILAAAKQAGPGNRFQFSTFLMIQTGP
jgi:hypothetical protein